MMQAIFVVAHKDADQIIELAKILTRASIISPEKSI